MSTENIFQIPLNEGFVGFFDHSKYSFLREDYTAKLSKKLETDIQLRQFFINHAFSDFFKKGKKRKEKTMNKMKEKTKIMI